MKILVVEDEPKVAGFLKKGMQEEGWQVTIATNGAEALRILEKPDFDLLVLDLMLPEIDGLSVLRILRKNEVELPVLLLTARDAISDRVTGLNAGADDYLVKPFAFDELLARIQALVRRSKGHFSNTLIAGDLLLDTEEHRVKRAGQAIRLTAIEYRLLELLLRNKGKVLSRIHIEEEVWGFNELHDSNSVDVYINHLRKKIDLPFSYPLIHTVRGFGYKLGEKNEE